MAVDQGEQPAPADAGLLPRRHQRGELRTVAQEPAHPPLEFGQRVEHVGLERLDREKRHQAHERADLERDVLARVEMEDVVEELVVLVPQGCRVDIDAVERTGDVQEVLEELGRQVLVDAVFGCQLEGNCEHVERVHPHPRRAVGLAQMAGHGDFG